MPKTQQSKIRYECQHCGTTLTATYAESRTRKRCKECGDTTAVPLPKIKLSGNKSEPTTTRLAQTNPTQTNPVKAKPARSKKKSRRRVGTTARGSVSSKKKPRENPQPVSPAPPPAPSTTPVRVRLAALRSRPIPGSLQTPLAISSTIIGVFFCSWLYNVLVAQIYKTTADSPAMASALHDTQSTDTSPVSPTSQPAVMPTETTKAIVATDTALSAKPVTTTRSNTPVIDAPAAPAGSGIDVSKDLLDALKN